MRGLRRFGIARRSPLIPPSPLRGEGVKRRARLTFAKLRGPSCSGASSGIPISWSPPSGSAATACRASMVRPMMRNHRHHPPRARARDQFSRHLCELRPGPQSSADRRGDPRPARRGRHPFQERQPARRHSGSGARRRRSSLSAQDLRGKPAQSRHRASRCVLHVARRSQCAGRGKRRRHGRAGARGQDAIYRALRMLGAVATTRQRGASARLAADGIFAVLARRRGAGADRGLPRARHGADGLCACSVAA